MGKFKELMSAYQESVIGNDYGLDEKTQKKAFWGGFWATAIILAVIGGCAFLYKAIKLDRNWEFKGEKLYGLDRTYVETTGRYTLGNEIGKTKDGFWIRELWHDEEHEYVLASTETGEYLYVDETYQVPTSGTVTSLWIDQVCPDKVDLTQFVEELQNADGGEYSFTTDNVYEYAKAIYAGYEGERAATVYIGLLARFDDTWVFIDPDEKVFDNNEDGSPKEVEITGEIIDADMSDVSAYFPKDDGQKQVGGK